MAGAAEALREALHGVEFHAGEGRFLSTTEGRFPPQEELRDVLVRQLTSPVRFKQSVEVMLQSSEAPSGFG